MDKREQLLEKVEQNYKTFLEELEDYDEDAEDRYIDLLIDQAMEREWRDD